MSTYVSFTPSTAIANAMFNFGAFGISDFKVAGTVRVSVSDSFSFSDFLSPNYSDFYSGLYTSSSTSNEVAWTAQMLANIQEVMSIYSQFANVAFDWRGDFDTFTSGSDTTPNPEDVGFFNLSDINITWIARSDAPFAGISGGSSDNLFFHYTGGAGDIFLNTFASKFAGDFSLGLNTRARQTLEHEIGHSLGLSHPHTAYNNGVATLTADYAATKNLGFDQLGFRTSTASDMYKEYFTIMSYDNQQSFLPGSSTLFHAHTPMILDVIALQQVYGEGQGTTGTGNDTVAAGNAGYRTYFDKGGVDTIDLALYTDGAYIHMGVDITGAAHLVGVAMSLFDAQTTILNGGDPANLRWFYGEFENVNGGSGNDLMIGNRLDNVINGLSGNDAIFGNEGDDSLSGGNGDDTLDGGAGNDTLIDGGGGNNTLKGGAGFDTYVVDNSAIVVVENPNEGIDTVQSSVSFVLTAANLENLTLLGSGNINGTGNSLENFILGNSGDNVIDGAGGLDTLMGGAGNDTYVAGNFVVIIENLNGGTDTLQSSVSFTLAANVENLTLTGGANINGTGNTLNNALTGNSGNNILDGGAGVDTLAGGTGNDTYFIDASDTVNELSGQGNDTVLIGASHTLGANVENVTLTGTGNFNATGNGLDNILFGNSGNNVLTGGLGNDTYGVDNAGDLVVENSSEGTDTIQSSISFDLASVANVENLRLTGSGPLSATGNAVNNVITGNMGDNTLSGGGGDDTLSGLGGLDTALLSQGRSAYTVSYAGGEVTLTSATDTTTLSKVETLDYASGADQRIASFFLESAKDANGDGHADIYWRNVDGRVALWTMDGFTVQGGAVLANVPVEWQIQGTGDFNADGNADLLWRNVNDGSVSFWMMDGFTVLTGGVFSEVPLEWQIQGTVDFDGDGNWDILWRNVNDGRAADWLMDGFTVRSGAVLSDVPLEWQIQGTADFDGDGSGDILWRNLNDGSVSAWLMDGLSVKSGGVFNSAPLEWQVAQTGDFDADGRSDILWRNVNDGRVAGWLMDGLTVQGGGVISDVPLVWQIAGTGDFNNDLRTDILWRNDSGEVAEWHMNGFTVQDGGVFSNVPLDWVIV